MTTDSDRNRVHLERGGDGKLVLSIRTPKALGEGPMLSEAAGYVTLASATLSGREVEVLRQSIAFHTGPGAPRRHVPKEASDVL